MRATSIVEIKHQAHRFILSTGKRPQEQPCGLTTDPIAQLDIDGLIQLRSAVALVDAVDDKQFSGIMVHGRRRLDCSTDADFAARIGVSLPTARRWLKGRSLPVVAARASHLIELSRAVDHRLSVLQQTPQQIVPDLLIAAE